MNPPSQATTDEDDLLSHKELKKKLKNVDMHRYLRCVEELDGGKHLRHHYVEWYEPATSELAKKRVSNVSFVVYKSLTKVSEDVCAVELEVGQHRRSKAGKEKMHIGSSVIALFDRDRSEVLVCCRAAKATGSPSRAQRFRAPLPSGCFVCR